MFMGFLWDFPGFHGIFMGFSRVSWDFYGIFQGFMGFFMEFSRV